MRAHVLPAILAQRTWSQLGDSMHSALAEFECVIVCWELLEMVPRGNVNV